MFLVPHLLCLLLGLLALDTVHASPLTEVKMQHDTLALDKVHADASAEVKMQHETLALGDVRTAALLAEVQLQKETLLAAPDSVHAASSAIEVKLQRGSCPDFWFSFNGRCYKYVGTHMTWDQAEWNCLTQDANLVSIHSVAEHNFVTALIRNSDPHQGFTWIGLTDTLWEGRWKWSDGCRVDFTLWYSGEPNNAAGNEHCGETNLGGKWNDRACSYTRPSVCASRTMCN